MGSLKLEWRVMWWASGREAVPRGFGLNGVSQESLPVLILENRLIQGIPSGPLVWALTFFKGI